MIITDVAWREKYSSAAFNRKFKGVIQPGIYGGFNVIADAGSVTITSDNSAALANVSNSSSKLIDGLGEYVISVHMTADVVMPVPVGVHSLVIRANYGIDEQTTTEFLFVAEPNQNDLVLCVIDMPTEGAPITIDTKTRAAMSVASEDFAVQQVNDLTEITKDATGFPDRLNSKLEFDDATRTVTLSPLNGDTFTVFYRNKKMELGVKSIQVADVSGGRYINIDPLTGELVEGLEFPNLEKDLLAAYVYYNSSQGKFVIKGDERHSSSRDTTWHTYTHQDNGMLWRRGGGLAYTAKDDTQITVGIGAPLIVADEDLEHTISHSDTPSADFEQILEGEAHIPVIYVDADGFYRQDEATNLPYKIGDARVSYNLINPTGKGSQEDAPSGKFVNYFLVATNCIEHPLKAIQGRSIFDTIEAAQNEKIDSYGLQLAEVAALYQAGLHVDDTYSNTMKVRIEAVFFPEQKKAGGIPTIGANLHEGLAGRSQPNQHPIGAVANLRETLDSILLPLPIIASLSKSNRFGVAFYMDGAALKTTQKIVSAVGSKVVSYDAGITVSLPELASGKDYKIYALETGTLQALEWDSTTPSNSSWIGGFLTSYSNGTIVERSLWDINWRPSCSPRGMALSIDSQVWADVYFMDVDYGITGYSRPDKTIADGSSLPKIPAIYGGNGTATYPAMTWYNAIDLASAAGKRLPTYTEFTAFAFGVVEKQSVGTDPITTKHQAGHRSASGIEQVTGVMWQWGADIQGSGSGWQDIAGGRGSVNATEIRAVRLGARWDDGAYSGSRASIWDNSPSYSISGVGARAVCDHQIH